MDDHTFQVLEYHRFLDFVARYACSEPGKDLIRALRPHPAADAALEHRDLLADFIVLRRQGTSLPHAAFESPLDILFRARPADAILPEEDLQAVGTFLGHCEQIHRFLSAATSETSSTPGELGRAISPCPELRGALDRVFNVQGEIRDDASPQLRELSRRSRQLENRIKRGLDAILRDTGLADAVQEQFVAIRSHRYVIPVRRELKSRIKGVVHDQSNSGQTLFIEPAVVLEEGNELAAARLEINDEIRRILAALTERVRSHTEELSASCAGLCRYDFAFAISDWAVDYSCGFAKTGETLALIKARHPLLHCQFRNEGREERLVPLDLRMAPDRRIIVITGSNTGGKTVILKTIGLLALIAQCGLPVPADAGTSMPFNTAIVADIGDEQSIEQSLSTFSGHMKQIGSMLTIAQRRQSLVLMDELGAGTDPIEGGALACAVLEYLTGAEALVFATTHLSMVKAFVHDHPLMDNASVRFNRETLEPEYVLQIGRPGASHALAIAERLRIPQAVLEQARKLIDSDQLQLDEILAQMDADQRRLSEAAATAADTRELMRNERQELKSELAALCKDRRRLLNVAQKEAAALVENARRQMEHVLQDAAQISEPERARDLRRRVDKKQRLLQKGRRETDPRAQHPLPQDQLSEGGEVWVEVLQQNAMLVMLNTDRSRATVEAGGKRFEVAVRQLGRPREDSPGTPPPRIEPRHIAPQQAASELNLVGFRVDKALPRLERFINDGMLAGLLQMRVIHGFGTGRLRQAIHEFLDDYPGIGGYRLGELGKDEGGEGVTWITL